MFKIIAIVCLLGYNGHLLECTRMEETDRRTFHTQEACIEEAGYKRTQIQGIVNTLDTPELYTIRVYCENLSI